MSAGRALIDECVSQWARIVLVVNLGLQHVRPRHARPTGHAAPLRNNNAIQLPENVYSEWSNGYCSEDTEYESRHDVAHVWWVRHVKALEVLVPDDQSPQCKSTSWPPVYSTCTVDTNYCLLIQLFKRGWIESPCLAS
jgi:hypothetical protein